MGGPRLIVDQLIVRRHTAKSRKLGDKIQELALRSPAEARDLEKLVDFALNRLDQLPPLPKLKP